MQMISLLSRRIWDTMAETNTDVVTLLKISPTSSTPCRKTSKPSRIAGVRAVLRHPRQRPRPLPMRVRALMNKSLNSTCRRSKTTPKTRRSISERRSSNPARARSRSPRDRSDSRNKSAAARRRSKSRRLQQPQSLR